MLIIGDYTARVGDPSGRSSLRPMLSAEEIDANAATFQEQAMRILDDDPRKLEVRHNREWLDMPMTDLLALVRTTTAAQLLEREDFAKRWEAKEPISLLELLYPLLQGYDSVAIDADVELGGTDQKFNLLLGRDIQRHYGRPQQAIMTMPILVGTDGTRKMSKSLGNQIGVTDAPGEMFGKTMAIPDEAMEEYYRLLVDPRSEAPARDVGELSGSSARDAKRRLARELVGWLHSPEEAAPRRGRMGSRLRADGSCPRRSRRRGSRDGQTVHVPALIAERVRDLALGGKAAAGAGRGVAGRAPARRRRPGARRLRGGRGGAARRQAPLPPPARLLSAGAPALPPGGRLRCSEQQARSGGRVRASSGGLRAGVPCALYSFVGPQPPQGAGSDRFPQKDDPSRRLDGL